MTIPDWAYISAMTLWKRRIPTRRRRAKWRAGREFDQALAEMRPGDIAIDCGANIGEFTRKMAATGATVYAFEPDPCAFEVLDQSLNSVTNVQLYNAAVGTHSDRVKLYRSAIFSVDPVKRTVSSSLFLSKNNVDENDFVPVQQIDLCSLIETLDRRIYLVKMDIEGAEVSILERLIETNLIHRIKHLFVETHEKQIPELFDRTRMLRKRLAELKINNTNLNWQ